MLAHVAVCLSTCPYSDRGYDELFSVSVCTLSECLCVSVYTASVSVFVRVCLTQGSDAERRGSGGDGAGWF